MIEADYTLEVSAAHESVRRAIAILESARPDLLEELEQRLEHVAGVLTEMKAPLPVEFGQDLRLLAKLFDASRRFYDRWLSLAALTPAAYNAAGASPLASSTRLSSLAFRG